MDVAQAPAPAIARMRDNGVPPSHGDEEQLNQTTTFGQSLSLSTWNLETLVIGLRPIAGHRCLRYVQRRGHDMSASNAFAQLSRAMQRWIWDQGWTELRDIQEQRLRRFLPGRT